MNTNMHRVTEDLAQTFRNHEGDDFAALTPDDDAEFLESLWGAVAVGCAALMSLLVCAIAIAFTMGWA